MFVEEKPKANLYVCAVIDDVLKEYTDNQMSENGRFYSSEDEYFQQISYSKWAVNCAKELLIKSSLPPLIILSHLLDKFDKMTLSGNSVISWRYSVAYDAIQYLIDRLL